MKLAKEEKGVAFIKVACRDDKVFMNVVVDKNNADKDTERATEIARKMLGRFIDEVEQFAENRKIFGRDKK